MLSRTISPLALALAFVTCLPAASWRAPDTRPDEFVLGAGTHAPADLLVRVATFLGRNILWDERELAAPEMRPFVIQSELRLDARGCEAVTSQLFHSRGFALVPLDVARGTWEMISVQGPRRGELASRAIAMSVDDVMVRADSYVPVRCVVPLENVAATRAATTLRPFFMSNGPANGLSIGTLGSDSALILQGFAAEVASAIEIIRTADRAATDEVRRANGRLELLERRIEALEKAGDSSK